MQQALEINVQNIYQTRGYANVIKFDTRLEKEDLEQHLQREIKREKGVFKAFVVFRPQGLLLYRDQSEANLIETIEYALMVNISDIGQSSLFFKTQVCGYALLLKNYNEENARNWLNNLLVIKQGLVFGQKEVTKIDISDEVKAVKWNSDQLVFKFDYQGILQELQKYKVDG